MASFAKCTRPATDTSISRSPATRSSNLQFGRFPVQKVHDHETIGDRTGWGFDFSRIPVRAPQRSEAFNCNTPSVRGTFGFDQSTDAGGPLSTTVAATSASAGDPPPTIEAKRKAFHGDGVVEKQLAPVCDLKPSATGVGIYGFGTAKHGMEMVFVVSTTSKTGEIPASVIFDFDQRRDTVAWERTAASGWTKLVQDRDVADNSPLTRCTTPNEKREIFDWDEPGFPSLSDIPGSDFETTTISNDATGVVVKNNFKNVVMALIAGAWKVISPTYKWHSTTAVTQGLEGWNMSDTPVKNEIAEGHTSLTEP